MVQTEGIDFTMTAMCRPELVRRTLESFYHGPIELRRQRLFLNVDPLPDPYRWHEVLAIAQDYFAEVICHTPATPSFPDAVKWCYSQSRAKYVFALEDDWELLHPVGVHDLIPHLEADQTLACVNLRAYEFDLILPKLLLSPGLWKGDAMRDLAGRLNTTHNPERQLWDMARRHRHREPRWGYNRRLWPDDKSHIILKDIGREWMAASGWKKNAPCKTNTFTHWEKA